MTDLNKVAQEIAALEFVASANVWNDRRVYVNLKGFDRSFAGDRQAKAYYDINAGWVVEKVKGTTSRAFDDSLFALKSHVNA